MATTHLSRLLNSLEKTARHRASLEQVNCPINREDLNRVDALAEVFGMTPEELVPLLLHSVLQEIEETMPYRQGSKVIRIEDGEPIYEDIGLTPRYLAAMRRLEREEDRPAGLKAAAE